MSLAATFPTINRESQQAQHQNSEKTVNSMSGSPRENWSLTLTSPPQTF